MSVATREGIKGGRPILRGSKLSVVQMMELIENGVSPEEVAESYSGVDSAEQVRGALEWVECNPDHVRMLREQRNESKQRLTEQAKTY